MKVLITGVSGLVGQALSAKLDADGHQPVALRRSQVIGDPEAPMWEPIRRRAWDSEVGYVDAVVHLAGENLAAHRWTPAFKRRIRDSRIVGTTQLCRHLATLNRRPRVLIAASAIGYYGDRGDEILTEHSSAGDGFLAQVCRDWEAACRPALDAGIRVVNLRFGMILSRDGSGLAKVLPLFKLGLGARLGTGRQWMSWITLDDAVAVITRVITDSALTGPVNAVAPNPVTNREYTHTLAAVLKRPAVLAVPAFALRLAMGEMADNMLLSSARVVPQRLTEIAHSFRHPDINTALMRII